MRWGGIQRGDSPSGKGGCDFDKFIHVAMMPVMAIETVFVYGTLRAGGSNHFRMGGAVHMGCGTVRGRLYRVDWYPALFLDPGADVVQGELYQVPRDAMASLDAFEGVEYRRVRVAVTCGNGGEVTEAWVWEYLDPVDESRRISTGDWFSEWKNS